MKKAEKLVVGTNVWLDYYLPGRPAHEEARRFLDAALAADVGLFVSIATVKDFHYLMNAQVKRMMREARCEEGQDPSRVALTPSEVDAARALARGYRDNMLELADVVGADASDVWLARKYEKLHDDFEDDLIIATMQRVEGDYLVTNDRQFIHRSPVATVSVQDATVLLGI